MVSPRERAETGMKVGLRTHPWEAEALPAKETEKAEVSQTRAMWESSGARASRRMAGPLLRPVLLPGRLSGELEAGYRVRPEGTESLVT